MILTLHQSQKVEQHTFNQIPEYLNLKIVCFNEARFEGYVRVNGLSPDLREKVMSEISGEVLETSTKSPAPLETEQPKVAPEVAHKTLDSWLAALADCRNSGFLHPKDSPTYRTLGFEHTPYDRNLPPTIHRLGVSALKRADVTSKVADLFGGKTPKEIQEMLSTPDGRKALIAYQDETVVEEKLPSLKPRGQGFIVHPEGMRDGPPRPKVVEVDHESVDSWLDALRKAQVSPGEVSSWNEHKKMRFGFGFFPEDKTASVEQHNLQVKILKGTYPSRMTASAFGLSPLDLQELLRTPEGREKLVLGDKYVPEPRLSPEDVSQYLVLAEAMLHDAVDLRETPEGGVEFPDVPLWGLLKPIELESEDRLLELRISRASRSYRPPWVPEGWGRFVLPADADRVGVVGANTEAKSGAFVRRNQILFRVFTDGYWDKSEWKRFSDLPERSGFVFISGGKLPSPEESIQHVLPLLEKEPLGPILKDLGKSQQD